MEPVSLAVADVVDEIGRARDRAQRHEGAGELRGHDASIEDTGGGRRGEDEQVLAPLSRPAGTQEHRRRGPPPCTLAPRGRARGCVRTNRTKLRAARGRLERADFKPPLEDPRGGRRSDGWGT